MSRPMDAIKRAWNAPATAGIGLMAATSALVAVFFLHRWTDSWAWALIGALIWSTAMLAWDVRGEQRKRGTPHVPTDASGHEPR